MRVRLDFVAGKVLPGRIAHTPPAWAEQLRIAEEVVVPCAQAIQPRCVDTSLRAQATKRGRVEQRATAGRAGIWMAYEPCVEAVCERLPATGAGLAQRAPVNGAAPERGELKSVASKRKRTSRRIVATGSRRGATHRRDSQAIKQANNRFPRRTGEKTRHDLALPFTWMLRMFKEKTQHFTTRIRPARVCITPARTAACPCVRRAVNGP